MPEMITGSTAVTYVHTSARKIVLPIATLRKLLNQGCGIFGAEYKNVIMADRPSQYQWGSSKKKKKTEPELPMKNNIR